MEIKDLNNTQQLILLVGIFFTLKCVLLLMIGVLIMDYTRPEQYFSPSK